MTLALAIALGALALSIIAMRYASLEGRRQLRAQVDLLVEEARLGIERMRDHYEAALSAMPPPTGRRIEDRVSAVELDFRKACVDLDCLGGPQLARRLVVLARLRFRADELAEQLGSMSETASVAAKEAASGHAYLH
jgi:hypothetical protein